MSFPYFFARFCARTVSSASSLVESPVVPLRSWRRKRKRSIVVSSPETTQRQFNSARSCSGEDFVVGKLDNGLDAASVRGVGAGSIGWGSIGWGAEVGMLVDGDDRFDNAL
jgi:hypothetical protein